MSLTLKDARKRKRCRAALRGAGYMRPVMFGKTDWYILAFEGSTGWSIAVKRGDVSHFRVERLTLKQAVETINAHASTL